MNARARELGLTHTHYTTPIGLDTAGNYSSAGDLVTLARYLLQTEPFFRATVATKHAVLRTGNHVRSVTNLNDLVVRVPWVNGVKTGHTLDAGYVLVASGTQHGMTLIDVVLGTSSEAARDSNALALLNWGFANFGMRTPVHAGAVLARPLDTDKPGTHVRLLAASTYTRVFPRSENDQAPRARAAEAQGPAVGARRRGVGGGRGRRPGRDPDPAAYGQRAAADQALQIDCKRGRRIGYAVRTIGGGRCGSRPDYVLARMDEG